jgi:CBS domain-containing protein
MKDESHRDPADPASGKPKTSGRFVARMFSGMSHPSVPVSPKVPASEEELYRALAQPKSEPGARFVLPPPAPAREVNLTSPAIDVMTDLTEVPAITINSSATIAEANRTMIARGVRALFVVDEEPVLVGIVTSTDIVGERPVQLARERGIRHDETTVRDIMTPDDLLEAMAFDDVLRARVGDVVATLRLSGRQHALAVERASVDAPRQTVRGIFSLTQIARQLGLPPQPIHDIARTFVAIESASGW